MNSSSSAPSYPWSMVCLIFDPMFQTKIQEHIWSVKCGVNLAQKLCRYPNLSEASTWSSRWVRQTVRNKPHPQVISRDLAGEIDKHQRHLIIPSYIFASFRLPSDLTGGGGRWNWSSPGTLGQPPFGQLYNIWFLTLFASLTIVQLGVFLISFLVQWSLERHWSKWPNVQMPLEKVQMSLLEIQMRIDWNKTMQSSVTISQKWCSSGLF